MSASVYESTTTAVSALRTLSHDDDVVLMESLMSPVLDALSSPELRGEGWLDTAVVPRLHQLLQRPMRGAKSSDESAFDLLFRVWRSGLTDAEGKPLDKPIEPFSRRAKWSLSTSAFAQLVDHFKMRKFLHERVFKASQRAKDAMEREFVSCRASGKVTEELMVAFSESAYVPRSHEVLLPSIEVSDRLKEISVSGPSKQELSQPQRFLRELLVCTEYAEVEKMLKSIPKEDVLATIPVVLHSKEIASIKTMIVSHEDFDSSVVERDMIATLNRITSSANANVSCRTMFKLASDLLWPVLVAPESTYDRLIHTAIAHSSQASIIIGTLRLVQSIAKARRSQHSAPYLLTALADLIRIIPNNLNSAKASDAIDYVCDELFSNLAGKVPILDPREGLLFIVLPRLTLAYLDEPVSGQRHGVHFALNILKHIVTTEKGIDVSSVEQTFPEGVLLGLVRVIQWCHSRRALMIQSMATTLAREISKALAKSFAKNPPSAEIVSGLRFADELAESHINWDVRLAIEPVMRLVRGSTSSPPSPPIRNPNDVFEIATNILKLCRAVSSDEMLVDLLETLQSCQNSLDEFQQSTLVACALVLPCTTVAEFERISCIALPALLRLKGNDVDEVRMSCMVLDVLSHSIIFTVRECPQRVFAISRHFTNFASKVVSEAKQTFDTDERSRSVVRTVFASILKVLSALHRSSKFTESQSCEVLLLSSALFVLQVLASSSSHKKWALNRVQSLPRSCASRNQLKTALC